VCLARQGTACHPRWTDLVTSRRDAKAATSFFRKLLTGLRYVPRVLVTDKLASYGVAHRRLMRRVEHRRSSI
jgi:putative transposase